MDEPVKKVKAQDLLPGSVILEIIKFDSKFSCLDSESLTFLQSTLNGAKAVTRTDSRKKSTIPMEKLKLFDDVTAITDLPQDSGYRNVTANSGQLLQDLGFLEFKVDLSAADASLAKPEAPGAAPAALQSFRLVEAKDILAKVGMAIELRNKSAARVEEMMDQGRSENLNISGAQEAVAKIINAGASSALKAVAGLKIGDRNYTHSVDVAVLFKDAYACMLADKGKKTTDEIDRSILLIGFLHDIGKCKVPKDLLESTEHLARDSKEMKIIQRHPLDGGQILANLGMSESAVNVAAYHHVKADASIPGSYPDVPYAEVMPLTRLAVIVDAYQAITSSRTFKPNMAPGDAVQHLLKMKNREYEERALVYFLRSTGVYPAGSLVRLSSGELAFVVLNEGKSLKKPVVAVVENANGELLSHNHLFDLAAEPKLSIIGIVDHHEHYNESENQALDVFRSISVK